MIRQIDDFLGRRSKGTLLFLSICAILAIGAVDFLTGYEFSVSTIYVLPIIATAWYAGKKRALILSAIGAAVSLLADVLVGHSSNLFYPLWNALMLSGFFVIITYLVSANRTLLAAERELARTDPLTGAANLRSFMEILNREIKVVKRYQRPLTLAYMDIDNFKAMNDTCGHASGDALLKSVVKAVRGSIRATDTVARMGGDEFMILLPETNEEQAPNAIEKINGKLLLAAREFSCPVTFSFGVITSHDPERTPDDLIKLADDLMYASKRKGKNTAAFDVLPLRRDP